MFSLQFLLIALVVVIVPGTGVIYTLALGLGQGRRAAIFAAAARQWLLGSEVVMRWLGRSFAAVFALLAGRLAMERA